MQGSATGNGIRTAVFAEGCAVPEYPTSSLRNGEEGTVVLALMVNASGKVDSAKVAKSSGYRSLDRAAQTALSLCKFQPAMDNGQPQAGWAQIAYNWKIDN
jgi:protein TonB